MTARHRWPSSAGYGLFPGGVGSTQKDPERFKSLYVGAERPHLEEWRARGS